MQLASKDDACRPHQGIKQWHVHGWNECKTKLLAPSTCYNNFRGFTLQTNAHTTLHPVWVWTKDGEIEPDSRIPLGHNVSEDLNGPNLGDPKKTKSRSISQHTF